MTAEAGAEADRDRVRLVDLRESALDVNEIHAALADDRAGGVVVFVGAVRDHDAGRGVASLSYSAHPTALQRLREVSSSVAERHEVLGVVALHRVGDLRVGDLAVAVGTCAFHREEAFAACRALIDELKATVPIWKRQSLTDGGAEWVGTP